VKSWLTPSVVPIEVHTEEENPTLFELNSEDTALEENPNVAIVEGPNPLHSMSTPCQNDKT
jgi:hypothetical protein